MKIISHKKTHFVFKLIALPRGKLKQSYFWLTFTLIVQLKEVEIWIQRHWKNPWVLSWGALPDNLKRINTDHVDMLKDHINIFLTSIPDQTTVAGLERAAETNSQTWK